MNGSVTTCGTVHHPSTVHHDTEPHSSDDESDEKTSEDSDDSDSDEDNDLPNFESKIQSTYRSLSSRKVDLIGDYAGAELFVIEGDSLLLHCFHDERLDFENGFQLLHAVYNVEQFLHQLIQRKANFKVVFFHCNDLLCIPHTTDEAHRSKYLLARSVIIRHLSVSLAQSHPTVSIDVFESWRSAKFHQYLRDTSPYFFMVHDGAQQVKLQAGDVVDTHETAPASTTSTSLRTMILALMEHGSNIALINELHWRDTKVMAVVLESRHRSTSSLTSSNDTLQERKVATRSVVSELRQLKAGIADLEEKQLLAIIVISFMLKDFPDGVSLSIWARLCCDFLLHQALLTHMLLSARRSQSIAPNEVENQFMESMAALSTSVLSDPTWSEEIDTMIVAGGIADYLDGRIFIQLSRERPQISHEVQRTYEQLLNAVKVVVGADSLLKRAAQPTSVDVKKKGDAFEANDSPTSRVTVLPFSNSVFDKHLECVRIDVDALAIDERSLASRKIFKEVSHWHNSTKPLAPKSTTVPIDAWQAKKLATRNQRLMADMQKYAASLTNAVGRLLEPETIIVGQPKRMLPTTESSSKTAEVSNAKAASKKGGGAKTKAKNATKTAMLDKQAADQEHKAAAIVDKSFIAWDNVRKDIDVERDPRTRYRQAQHYLGNSQQALREIIGTECELYLINCLVTYWNQICQANKQTQHLYVVALIWNALQSVAKRDQQSKSSVKYITSLVDSLGLPLPYQNLDVTSERKPAFSLVLPASSDLSKQSYVDNFQLVHCGAYLERSFNSKADARVDFRPDEWQRRVLDSIDANQSVFVVAPTSAGKTFISFYAMRKVLEADDDGVLVYVAPTKALVNQIAAEIQGRYSKTFKHGGKSVWAIHTRDHRINNPNGCQVLVTVPHVLQIMLLAPSNAKSWSNRIRRIIFDEIHSIGQAEDGVVWEQLLLMAPSPIIALSATVGNPTEFAEWLTSTQTSMGHELTMIEHPHRYSDLRKYFYVPPKKFAFTGLADKTPLNDLSLDGLPGLNFVNPIATLVDRSRGIPDDLALEPRDCLYLWQTMKALEKGAYIVPDSLDPKKSLPETPRQHDILTWGKALKTYLLGWLEDPASPFEELIRKLESNFRNEIQEEEYLTSPSTETSTSDLGDANNVVKSTLPLLSRLHERDALPAIFFNYDRHQCERICQALLKELVDAEALQMKSGAKWQRKLVEWEAWKEAKKKAAAKGPNAKKPSKKSKDKTGDDDLFTKADLLHDSPYALDQKWERFDPNTPQDGYHFADHTKLQHSELAEYVRELQYREIAPWLIEALERGIGVHHAGMNRKYREVVEILFRKRFLRVIIATGTLALGINMPCKTVVFSGDSVFLTALNYRQCAGRAGRRGFDLMGNVVFQGISRQKVCRLITSRLPSLTGHFPITTSFVLRLFILLHESGNSRYAVTAVNSVLSQPRLHMGGQSFKDQTMHHLRFSIEYLRRQHLLDSDGAPLNLAGLVSHLYYTENSSFAFHALLKEGYFNTLCANIKTDEKGTLETLMLVMSHLFNRLMHRHSDMEVHKSVAKKSSSMIFLPPLPEAASQILRGHNEEILDVYKAYVRTFIDQHISEACNTLPLTGTKCGGSGTTTSLTSVAPVQIRSAFVALSGADDNFSSIHDLCSTVRSGVFLEESVIPYIEIYPDDMEVPLNAWLLDFYRHGDVMTLERDNGVRRSDVWFHLNDFSLVLATIVTSMVNFMKLSNNGDRDMLDVQGQKDIFEETKEDESTTLVEAANEKRNPAKLTPVVEAVKRVNIKEKLPESWEDVDETPSFSQATTQVDPNEGLLAEELDAWDAEEDGGLKDVLTAFQKLQVNFNEKFRAMWA